MKRPFSKQHDIESDEIRDMAVYISDKTGCPLSWTAKIIHEYHNVIGNELKSGEAVNLGKSGKLIPLEKDGKATGGVSFRANSLFKNQLAGKKFPK